MVQKATAFMPSSKNYFIFSPPCPPHSAGNRTKATRGDVPQSPIRADKAHRLSWTARSKAPRHDLKQNRKPRRPNGKPRKFFSEPRKIFLAARKIFFKAPYKNQRPSVSQRRPTTPRFGPAGATEQGRAPAPPHKWACDLRDAQRLCDGRADRYCRRDCCAARHTSGHP